MTMSIQHVNFMAYCARTEDFLYCGHALPFTSFLKWPFADSATC